MGVVRLEPSDPGEAGQGSGQLVPVKHSKVGHVDWQVLVEASRLIEHQAVARAVHWLQPKVLLLNLELEHAVGVVARDLPQLGVVDIGADHLLEAHLTVLLLQNAQQLVVVGRPWAGRSTSRG